MVFEIPATHEHLRSSVRQFCQREVQPYAAQWDEQERFPMELVPKLAAVGLLGLRIPEVYGGAGLDMLAYALCVEEVASFDGSLALTVASHNGLGTGHVLAFGSEAQKHRYLTRAASGEWLAAWALTEPDSGSDAASLRTVAERREGRWVLRGTKSFITQGSVAGFCVVLARTDAAARHRGITAFIVERGMPGFASTKHIRKLGMRASDTVELHFDDVCLDDAQVLGDVGQGFVSAMRILDQGRIAIAALACGLAAGALAQALRYSKERRQFGQPIADFQAIQWMLADSYTELEAARLLTYRAAHLADRGLPCSREAAAAKLYAAEAASRICSRSLQVHGGYGYTREYPIERFLRDARLCEIGEGTSEVQRLVIARSLLE